MHLVRSVSIGLLLAALSATVSALDVLGFELSVTTRQVFLDRLKGNTTLNEILASDRYIIHGYTVLFDQEQFPSMKRAGFMFDASDRLCMVFLEVPPELFDVEVERARGLYRLIGATRDPNGARDAYFSEGTNRISIEIKPQWPSAVVMMMNAAYRKDSDARLRANGFQSKYD